MQLAGMLYDSLHNKILKLADNVLVYPARPVKASLSVGFCAAVAPLSAQTITTSAEGLIAGEMKVPAGDADIPAYRATPKGGGPFPTVLVIHEIFGVHEHIKDVCRRWARLGYYAIAPELFARQGDAAKETDIPRLMATIVGKKSDTEVAATSTRRSASPRRAARPISRAPRSSASAGAGARPGSTPRTTRSERPRSPGTGRSACPGARCGRRTRPTSSAS